MSSTGSSKVADVEKHRGLWKLDMSGKWWADEECNDASQAGAVYYFRLQVAEGAEGDAIWLGTEEDRPFCDNHDSELTSVLSLELASSQ